MEMFIGITDTFVAPSGHTFTIREQNGEDDETLSLVSEDSDKEENISNHNKFLASLIKENTFNGKAYLTLDEVKKLKLKDKYYILFRSRLHSVGKMLKFDATCPKEKCGEKHKFSQDLNEYDTDLSKFEEDKPRYKYQITPHPLGQATHCEFTISNGNKLRYELFTVAGEFLASKLTTVSDNTEVDVRNLELWENGEWKKLSSYNIFSKRDMIEIKANIKQNDSQFMMFIELECPKCKFKWELPFLHSKHFFFPGEI